MEMARPGPYVLSNALEIWNENRGESMAANGSHRHWRGSVSLVSASS